MWHLGGEWERMAARRLETQPAWAETMKTLKEFLREHAEIERRRADEKKAVQHEWIISLHRLVEQIKGWLHDADEEHQLEIEEIWHKLREIDVGVYDAPGLVIRLEAEEVQVKPVARMVVGPFLSNGQIRMNRSFGRVDLTNGGENFKLFRSQKDPSDEWVIVEEVAYRPKKFDLQAFGEAMQRLLE
jgi:hypothetical protein